MHIRPGSQLHPSLVRLNLVFCLGALLMISALSSATDVENGASTIADTIPLSTAEIRLMFSDVRDDAEVQDASGTTAVNYWYGDGRFINRWSNDSASGTVTGQWRAVEGKRCIVIVSGLPDRIGKESCAPLYRQGSTILSINSDGGIHGIHRLSPLRQP